MQNRPVYAVTSVDNALRIAQMLQAEGSLRVSDVADRLGIAVSTAHRLLQTLAYRDFAQQQPDRTYAPGTALRSLPTSSAPATLLCDAATAVMGDLVEEVQESSHLMVLAGTEVQFIGSVECRRALAVGDRTGRSLPARLTSGGKAMLAALPPQELDALYADVAPPDLSGLRRQLGTVRRRGYAVNRGETEPGLTAIGWRIDAAPALGRAALCIALPSARCPRDRLPELVDALHRSIRLVERQLAAYAPG